jgi:hypothetical protein
MAKANENYGKESFNFEKEGISVQLGGKRAPQDMWEQLKDPFNPEYKDTWKVATNELTWLVRSVKVNSAVNVGADGTITINHSFTDVFDLRPSSGRNSAYNTATSILGFFYHDVFGGNDQMKISATWSTTIK